jgi:hypothetical protein
VFNFNADDDTYADGYTIDYTLKPVIEALPDGLAGPCENPVALPDGSFYQPAEGSSYGLASAAMQHQFSSGSAVSQADTPNHLALGCVNEQAKEQPAAPPTAADEQLEHSPIDSIDSRAALQPASAPAASTGSSSKPRAGVDAGFDEELEFADEEDASELSSVGTASRQDSVAIANPFAAGLGAVGAVEGQHVEAADTATPSHRSTSDCEDVQPLAQQTSAPDSDDNGPAAGELPAAARAPTAATPALGWAEDLAAEDATQAAEQQLPLHSDGESREEEHDGEAEEQLSSDEESSEQPFKQLSEEQLSGPPLVPAPGDSSQQLAECSLPSAEGSLTSQEGWELLAAQVEANRLLSDPPEDLSDLASSPVIAAQQTPSPVPQGQQLPRDQAVRASSGAGQGAGGSWTSSEPEAAESPTEAPPAPGSLATFPGEVAGDNNLAAPAAEEGNGGQDLGAAVVAAGDAGLDADGGSTDSWAANISSSAGGSLNIDSTLVAVGSLAADGSLDASNSRAANCSLAANGCMAAGTFTTDDGLVTDVKEAVDNVLADGTADVEDASCGSQLEGAVGQAAQSVEAWTISAAPAAAAVHSHAPVEDAVARGAWGTDDILAVPEPLGNAVPAADAVAASSAAGWADDAAPAVAAPAEDETGTGGWAAREAPDLAIKTREPEAVVMDDGGIASWGERPEVQAVVAPGGDLSREDGRVAWSAVSAARLAGVDKEEREARAKLRSAAEEYLQKVAQVTGFAV